MTAPAHGFYSTQNAAGRVAIIAPHAYSAMQRKSWRAEHRAPAACYAFVGSSEEAVQTQIRLTLQRYRSKADPQTAIESALKVPDECGGPPVYLLKTSWLWWRKDTVRCSGFSTQPSC